MVSSKKVTGFFAIAVVAFMVATAFVPAVNAFATSDDDAAIATVKTDGDDQNQNIDITDKTDLMSILSSLFGGADVSKLAELFEGIDLKALMEEVSSLDSATIFDYVKGLLKQTGIFSGKDLSDAAAIISQLLEGDTDYNALLEMLMNLFGVEGSKSIYIPDLVIGDYELIGVTITVDFDEGEFSSASIDVSELIAEGDTGVEYAITGLYVLIATDVAEFYLKTIKFADAEFTIDTDAVLRLTDSGLELDVDVANDLSIFAELTITGMGVQEHISVTLAEVKVDTIQTVLAVKSTLEGLTITFTDGTEAAFSGSVVNATTEDGTDVTAFFNAFLDGFFKEKPEVAVNIDLQDLQIADLRLKDPQATMGFVDGNLKTTLTTSQFGFGTASEPHIIGFNLTTETVLGHNYVSMKDTIDSINVALPGTTYQVLVQGIKQSIVGPYNVDVMASIDYVKFVSLDGVTAEMGTSNPTTDYVHAFLLYSDYDAVYETYSTVAIHVDSAMVTIPASANDEPEVFFTPGFNLIGKFDGTDDHGHDFVHATLRMIVFEYADSTKAAQNRLAYYEADYKDTDLAATLHSSYESYSEEYNMTYLAESRVVFGEDAVHSEVRFGAGIGQSVHLGADTFFCVFVTGTPDELESDYYAEYQTKGDNEHSIWRIGLKVGEDNGVFSIRAKNIEYIDANHYGISVGDVAIRVVMEGGVVRTVILLEDVSLGLEDQGLSAEIIAMMLVEDGFTGQKTFHFVSDDIRLGNTTVSESIAFDMVVDKDGKFVSAPTAEGDLDLTLSAFKVADNLTIDGTAKITSGKLAVNMTFTDGSSNASLGSFKVTDDAFELNFNDNASTAGYTLGPFTDPQIAIALGNVTTVSMFYGAKEIGFSRTGTDPTNSYMSDVQHKTDGTFLIGGIRLGQHSTNDVYDIEFVDVKVILKDGYTITIDSFGTNLDYTVDEQGQQIEIAKISSAFGVAGAIADPGLYIRCTKENNEIVNEYAFRIRYIDSFITVGLFKFAGTIGDVTAQDNVTQVTLKEDSFGNTVSIDVINYISQYTLTANIAGSEVKVFEAKAEKVYYSETAKDGIIQLSADLISVQRAKSIMAIGTLAKTEGKDEYTIQSFSLTGFGSEAGKLINEGAITIDDTAAGKTVVTIPKLKLDQTAAAGNNKLDIVGVKLTFIDGSFEPEVEIASIDAAFNNFKYVPTESTINGTFYFNSAKILDTKVDIKVDQIEYRDTTVENFAYCMYFTQTGTLAENLMTFDSLTYSTSVKIDRVSFNFLTGVYTAGKIYMDEYEVMGYTIDANIENLAYQNTATAAPLPEMKFAVDKLTLTVSDGVESWTYSSGDSPIRAMLHTSATQTGNTVITLSMHGSLSAVYTDGTTIAAMRVTLEDFAAKAESTQDRSSWNVEVAQTVAKLEVGVYVPETSTHISAIYDASKDTFSGKMTVGKDGITITGTQKHDDILSATGSEVESTSQEYVGTGVLTLTAPAEITSAAGISMTYKYTLEKLTVSDGDKTVDADVKDTSFEFAFSSVDDYVASLCLKANISYAVGSQEFAIDNLHLDAKLSVDPEEMEIDDAISASFTADRFHAGMGDVSATLNSIAFENGFLVADTMNIRDNTEGNKIDITFNNTHVIGSVFWADSMEGYVNDFDVDELKYDKTKALGDQLFAYRGLFYFSLDGIKAFTNDEPVEPSDDYSAVIYVPSYELTFIEPDGQGGSTECSYAVPVGSVVKLGAYYDATPYPDVELGIPVTTDKYCVQHCNMELTPSPTLLDRLKASPEGVIVLEGGSGIVYNSAMLDQVALDKITIITPQNVKMVISVNALKTLATGCDTTVLGITMSYADQHMHLLKDILDGLSEENVAKVLDGKIIHVDTGYSTKTDGLGEVKITIPYDLADGAAIPKFSSFNIIHDTMIYNGVSNYEVIAGQGYLTFTVSHFSTFLVCEELNFAPSNTVAIVICIVMVAVAGIAQAIFLLRRQNTI